MCEILNIQKIEKLIIIDCSIYDADEDFTRATILKIRDKKGNTVVTKKFKVEKTRPCFSQGGSPWITLNEDIPENFLEKGNKIYFE